MDPNMPAGIPPPGIKSDFSRPPPDAPRLIAINAVFLPIALIFLLARLWTRARLTKTFDIDDGIIILAFFLSVALGSVSLYVINYGMGQHIWDVPVKHISPHFLMYQVVNTMLYCFGMGTVKVSILLFYLRIFPGKTFRYVIFVLIFIAAGFSTGSAFSALFACTPIQKTWDTTIQHGSCINTNAMYFAFAGIGIATDIMTLVAPLPLIKNLQLPNRQKIILAALLIMGTFVCVVSIIRLKSIYTLANSDDITYNVSDAMVWSNIEMNIGIAGGCAPTLRPFLRHYMPGVLGGTGAISEPLSYNNGSRPYNQSHQLSSLSSARAHHGRDPSSHKGTFTNTITSGNNSSEEHMVPRNNDGGIVKTVEYDLRVA